MPPQDIEAEQAVLGSMLIDPVAPVEVMEIIGEDDFYRVSHRHIFSAMIELFERGESIDVLTVRSVIERRGVLDDVGGSAYLTRLSDAVFSAANVSAYARVVHSRSMVRQLLERTSQIAAECYTHSGEADELLDEAERSIFEIADSRIKQGFYPLSEVVHKTVDELERLAESKELVTGIPSGFPDLDELTAGFQKSDLIIIAGRPSMGKTALALNVALNATRKTSLPVAIFSLEMSKEQLAMRLISAESKINARQMRTGSMDDMDWTRLMDATGRLYEAQVFIDDTPALTPLQMRAKARRLKSSKGLGLVVLDYLQLMRGRANPENRVQEVSEISRSLKAMAKELSVPVIALSQLNRKVEDRPNRRPMLSDLRESGAIEQDADVIMFIYRDDVYNKSEENPFKGTAEIVLEKQRNGPTGQVWLTFIKECTAFESMDKETQAQLREARKR